MSPISEMKKAIDKIENAVRLIESAPEKNDIMALISALSEIEGRYKSWCADQDELNDDKDGTCYENGTFMEFEVDSMLWHEVSQNLRKLIPAKGEKS